MGKCLELVAGHVTAPSTTQTALTMVTGASATVRNARDDSLVALLQAWTDVQVAGTFRIRSPRLHDAVQGIRIDTVVSEPRPVLPRGIFQPLIPHDQLTLDLSGSGVAGDIETACLLIYYADLLGADADLRMFDEVYPRIVDLMTIENTLALGTAGGVSGEEALNAEFDLVKSGTEYAILGYLVDGECAAVRWRGSFTSNFALGGPGLADEQNLTRDWFVQLARDYGLPLIPVFNGSDIDGVLIDGIQDENGTDVTVTTILGVLG